MDLGPRRSERLNDKRRKLPGNSQLKTICKKAKKPTVKISTDVLRDLIEWLPLKKLPKVTLTSRRFWLYSDENLDSRKHTIEGMEVSGTYDGARIIYDGNRVVPYATVEPPKNFRLSFLHVRGEMRQKAIRFLRVSRPLFVGGRLNFTSIITCKLLAVFDGCAQVSIRHGEIRTQNRVFFGQTTIANCSSIRLFNTTTFFDPKSVLEWLHTKPVLEQNSKRLRQLYFRERFGALSPHPLIELIKKHFSNAKNAHTFMIRLVNNGSSESENFRMENAGTKEVLFSRIDGLYWELIRCGKGQEDSVKYEEISGDEHPIITI